MRLRTYPVGCGKAYDVALVTKWLANKMEALRTANPEPLSAAKPQTPARCKHGGYILALRMACTGTWRSCIGPWSRGTGSSAPCIVPGFGYQLQQLREPCRMASTSWSFACTTEPTLNMIAMERSYSVAAI